jgi:hypothetical protein
MEQEKIVAMAIFKQPKLPVSLQSFGSDAGHARTYTLKPSANTAGNQLLFKEAAQNIGKVLAANGYVKDEQSPVLQIEVDYTITASTKQEMERFLFMVSTREITCYTSVLTLIAFDYKELTKNNTRKEVWRAESSSVNVCDDLRMVLPYLIASTANWIGKDSRQRIDMSFEIKDKFDMDWSLRLQKEYGVVC